LPKNKRNLALTLRLEEKEDDAQQTECEQTVYALRYNIGFGLEMRGRRSMRTLSLTQNCVDRRNFLPSLFLAIANNAQATSETARTILSSPRSATQNISPKISTPGSHSVYLLSLMSTPMKKLDLESRSLFSVPLTGTVPKKRPISITIRIPTGCDTYGFLSSLLGRIPTATCSPRSRYSSIRATQQGQPPHSGCSNVR